MEAEKRIQEEAGSPDEATLRVTESKRITSTKRTSQVLNVDITPTTATTKPQPATKDHKNG